MNIFTVHTWVVLILEGCISLAPPYQQIKYSTDFHIETMIAEISKETALKILEVNLRDNTNTSVYYDPLYFGVKLRENSKRGDAVVTEEFISSNIIVGIFLMVLLSESPSK